ncbi:MAG: ABC transporter ATP-binding protein [Erysipelotrichaceae bacterium]
MMTILRVDHLTKDYKKGRGVFDISFEIKQGEVFGFLGPNGAGKTTTIRHLLGFSKPQKGSTSVFGLDAWKHPKIIQNKMGYLPGEISFPDEMTGIEFIKYIAALRGMKDFTKAEELMKRFQLDPSGKLKKMSKGMKQKTAIVCAFMHDPELLILDEPTSGLDPLMQQIFIELIREEKSKGKTILMSSHLFEEVEGTCDRIAIIKEGKIVTVIDPLTIRHNKNKRYKIEFIASADYASFIEESFGMLDQRENLRQVVVEIEDACINDLIEALHLRPIKFISEIKVTLEETFMNYYKEEIHHD